MNLWMDIVWSVLLAAGIFLLNAAIFKKFRSPAHPAVVFSVFFSLQMIFSLILLQQDLFHLYWGFLWLTAAIAAFAAGGLIVSRGHKWERQPVERRAGSSAAYDSPWMVVTLVVLLLASFAQPVTVIYQLGYSLRDLFDIRLLLDMNSSAAHNRYVTHQSTVPVAAQLFLVLVYLLPLIGGWNFLHSKKKATKILCLMTVLPSLLVLLTQNTKAAFIGSVFLFVCSLTTARLHLTGRFFSIGKKQLPILGGLVAAFLLLNFFSFFLREGNKATLTLFVAVFYKSLNYLLGQMPAFNYWLSGSHTLFPQSFGLKTFYSVSDLLGILKREPGIYTEKLKTDALSTNVYTAFRPLIEDFSIIGALLALFLVGLLAGLCYRRLRQGRGRSLDIAFHSAVYFYLLYAFITSAWAYVSYTAAFLFFFIYLVIVRGLAGARPGGKPRKIIGGRHAGI